MADAFAVALCCVSFRNAAFLMSMRVGARPPLFSFKKAPFRKSESGSVSIGERQAIGRGKKCRDIGRNGRCDRRCCFVRAGQSLEEGVRRDLQKCRCLLKWRTVVLDRLPEDLRGMLYTPNGLHKIAHAVFKNETRAHVATRRP